MKILIINGPNLNLLGERDETQYGNVTLSEIHDKLTEEFPGIDFEFFQSNLEGEIIEKIQNARNSGFVGLVINPGGYSHTSVAIRDALELVDLPKIEVHLSNLAKREEFRRNSLTATACTGYISGFKEFGYLAAVYLIRKLQSK